MAKEREIKRLSAKQKTDFERLKKNVKSKISRVKKNFGIDISGEIEIPSLTSFKTYEELNEWKEKASSITNRNNIRYKFKKNEHGLAFSVFEQRQGEKLFKEAKRQREKEIKRLEQKPFIVNGQVAGNRLQKGLIMDRPSNAKLGKLEPFDINNFRTRMGLENRLEKLKDLATGETYAKRLVKMKESWLETIRLVFHDMADDIVDRIEEMSPDDFYEFYDTFESTMNFELFYNDGELGSVNEGFIEQIEEYLDQYERDEMNPIFKVRNKKRR